MYKKKKKILQMLHTSMNIDRYKSVEPGQYNENNFGHTSGERSFPVRHGCHPIHESSLDSRGSYVSDSCEKLNRIPPLPPPVWWIGSFEIRTTCSHPPNRLHHRVLAHPSSRRQRFSGSEEACTRAVYAVYYTLGATIASLRDTRPNKCRICKIGGP